MMRRLGVPLTCAACLSVMLMGCGDKKETEGGAPPPAKVEKEQDASLVQVEHAEQFPYSRRWNIRRRRR